jgi:hypothetical protein
MTAATTGQPASGDSPHDRGWQGRRRLPMAAVSWRLQRSALLALALAVLAFTVMMIVTGLRVRSGAAGLARHHCTPSSPSELCGALNSYLVPNSRLGPYTLSLMPAIAGVLLGAPLFAREFESGTAKFALTQGTGRARWTLGRLALPALVAAVLGCWLGLVAQWWTGPFARPMYNTPGLWWDSSLFGVSPLSLAGWAVLGVSVGALAGLLLRRTVLAMAAAAAATGGLLVLAMQHAYSSLLSVGAEPMRAVPLLNVGCSPACGQVLVPPGLAGSYTAGGWLTGAGGRRLSASAQDSVARSIPAAVRDSSPAHLISWLSGHHLSYWVSVQPGSRFWLFQVALLVILAALAALVLAAAVLLSRRQAG